jgi:hypothetical protein
MPNGTSGAVCFVVRVVNPCAGFFDVSTRIRTSATFQQRRENEHKLRHENQQ